MSFMPNVGTVVRLKDGRIGAVSSFTPLGDDDRVVFPDGHEERSDAWQIAEMLSDEPDPAVDPVHALAEYLAKG